MIPIQECAQQLLSDSPGPLYFLTGPEYGVKSQYLEALSKTYDGCVESYDSLADLVQALSKKSIIPRKPSLYVVRYDKDYLKGLDATAADKLKSLKFQGTIVALYSDDKDESKIDKHFPKNTVRINFLTEAVQKKHLMKQFPKITERALDTIIKISDDFYQATLLCRSLNCLPESKIAGFTSAELCELFGYRADSNASRFKTAVAARNYAAMVQEIDAYTDDYSLLFYDILSTYLEIAKMLGRKYGESFVTPYLKLWNHQSLATMYDITYEQLNKVRSNSSYPPYIAIMYTCSLLQFRIG